MFNDIHLGPFTLHMYGLMTAVGILAAYFSAEYRAKKKGLREDKVFLLVIFCLIFGYLGSKILYLLTQLPSLIQDPSQFWNYLSTGWVVLGGILGGILGGVIYCRWQKLKAWSYFDLGLASVALAQGFGRIGCFFAGCCYGAETSGPIAITFPEHNGYGIGGVPRVPTQLYSSALDFLLFFFLIIYDKKCKKREGEITGLYLFFYSVGRFILEFWRGDIERGSIGVLSTSQFLSIFTAIAGGILFVMRRKSKPEAVAEEAVVEEITEEETKE